jgi:hypothetical protein
MSMARFWQMVVLADGLAAAATDTFLGYIDMKATIGRRTRAVNRGSQAGVGFFEGALPDEEGRQQVF